MKKNIRIILPVILVVSLIYAGYKMVELSKQKKVQAEKIAYIPSFELETTLGETFTNKDLKVDLPVVFFFSTVNVISAKLRFRKLLRI